MGVAEWIMYVIKAMYEKSATVIRQNGRESKEFLVTVGVHQGSVLSLLLFVIVLEAHSKSFREGLLMELLYVDNPGPDDSNQAVVGREVAEVERGYGKERFKSQCV